ncbi:hypothetical protein MBLNU230_g3109t1 [Neophaeotheca triangularis]
MTEGQGIKTMMTGLASLYKSGEHSDLKIKCGWFEMDAHKSVLCTQSEFFKAAFKIATFKVSANLVSNRVYLLTDGRSSRQEGKEGVITLRAIDPEVDDDSADSPEMVSLLMKFLYHHNYRVAFCEPVVNVFEPCCVFEPKYTSSMLIDAQAFAIAVKYLVPGLRELAASRFEQAVNRDWMMHCFAPTVYVVFKSTPEDVKELRSVIVQAIVHHRRLLKEPDIIAAMEDIHSLWLAVLTELAA